MIIIRPNALGTGRPVTPFVFSSSIPAVVLFAEPTFRADCTGRNKIPQYIVVRVPQTSQRHTRVRFVYFVFITGNGDPEKKELWREQCALRGTTRGTNKRGVVDAG